MWSISVIFYRPSLRMGLHFRFLRKPILYKFWTIKSSTIELLRSSLEVSFTSLKQLYVYITQHLVHRHVSKAKIPVELLHVKVLYKLFDHILEADFWTINLRGARRKLVGWTAGGIPNSDVLLLPMLPPSRLRQVNDNKRSIRLEEWASKMSNVSQ